MEWGPPCTALSKADLFTPEPSGPRWQVCSLVSLAGHWSTVCLELRGRSSKARPRPCAFPGLASERGPCPGSSDHVVCGFPGSLPGRERAAVHLDASLQFSPVKHELWPSLSRLLLKYKADLGGAGASFAVGFLATFS